MSTFKEFLSQQPAISVKPEKWKASKDEIINYWKSLRSDTPLMVKPIEYSHTGSTYGEDGLRITGSPQFIGTVLGRLKDFLAYETPSAKLAVTFRETESPSQTAMGHGKTSYVFYVAVRERGSNPK